MRFQEFNQLIQSAPTYKDLNQFKAAARAPQGVSENQLNFIWEFSHDPTFPTIRRLSGLTQAAFAAAYPPPKRSIENWDTGQRNPTVPVIILLAFAVCSDL